LAREPNAAELATLEDFLNRQRQRFVSHSADPWPLISDNKSSEDSRAVTDRPGKANPAEFAAWTALARVVVNLDETITKE
jgi:hypothetical protein